MKFLRRANYSSIASAVSYDSDALLYFASASISDPVEMSAVNNFILGLKSNSFYTRYERLYLISPTSLSAALIDFITLTSATATNSPTYATTGFTFDGATNYIDTGFIPSAGSKIATSNYCYQIYVQSAASASSKTFIGANNNLNGAPNRIDAQSGTTWRFVPGSSLGGIFAEGTFTGLNGFTVGSTNTIPDTRLYQNSTVIDNQTGAGNRVRTGKSLFIGANNNNGSANRFHQFSTAFVGISTNFSTADEAILNTLHATYQAAVISGGR